MSRPLLAIGLWIIVLSSFGAGLFMYQVMTQPPLFNFVFKYGVGAKNELNTFNNTYTRDMVCDPSITVELVLAPEEKEQIYQKMIEIDFFNYPKEFPKNPLLGVTPCSKFYFRVSYNYTIKEVSWTSEALIEKATRNDLEELMVLIRDIIESKEAYQNLPEPRCFYI